MRRRVRGDGRPVGGANRPAPAVLPRPGRPARSGARFGRCGLVLALALALVGAVPAAAPGAGGPAAAPSRAAVADPPPDPGRIAYVGDGWHHGLVTVGPRGSLAPALPVGVAGNDCEASARGDDLVWVSDRDGDAEGVYRRTADGAVHQVLRKPAVGSEPGWRLVHPVLSPDRQWIAFVGWQGDEGDGTRSSAGRCDAERGLTERDARPSVWVVKADGSGAGLREAVADADWFDWSPDGTEFVFTRDGVAYRTTVAAGGAQVRVTGDEEGVAKPAWEPAAPGSEDRIAYVSWRWIDDDPGCGTACVTRGRPADGAGVRAAAERRRMVLATVPARPGDATPEVLAVGDGYTQARSGVAWSPDAKTIAFLSAEPYLVDATAPACGTCAGTPVFDPDAVVGYETESVTWYGPAAGGDGGPVLLLGGTDPESTNIENSRPVLPADRLQLRALQGREYDLADPAYSPDGTALAFVASASTPSEAPDEQRILVGGPEDLAAAVRLTYEDPERELPDERQSRPAWSPDGTKLAFARWGDEGQSYARITVVDVSGGAAHAEFLYDVPWRLPAPGYACDSDDRDPAWSPDGTRLVFSRWSSCRLVDEPGLRAVPRAPAATPPAATPPAGDRSPGAVPPGSGAPGPASSGPASPGSPTAGSPASDAPSSGSGRAGAAPPGPSPAAPRTGAVAPAAGRAAPTPAPLLTGDPGDQRDRHIWNAEAFIPSEEHIPRQFDVTARQCGSPGCLVVDVRPAWNWGDGTIAFVRQATLSGPGLGAAAPAARPRAAGAPAVALGSGYDGPRAVLRMKADGTGCTGLLPRRTDDCPLAPSELPGEDGTGWSYDEPDNPAWTPDGQRLAVDVLVTGHDSDANPRTRRLMTLDPAAPATARILAGKLYNGQSQPTWEPGSDLRASLTTPDDPLLLGGTATLVLEVWNRGNAPAPRARARFTLPPGMEAAGPPVPPPGGGTCGPDLVCDLGTLPSGTRTRIELKAKAVAKGAQTVTAAAESGLPDPRPGDNTVTLSVNVVVADLALTATATPPVVDVGEPSTVVFTVRNLGTAGAQDVRLKLTVPPGLTLVSGTACPPTGCALGTLAPGAVRTVTAAYTAAAAFSGSIDGTVSTGTPDDDGENDEASVDLTVVDPRLPDPTVTVTATPPVIATGHLATLTYTVRNAGDAPARDVHLTTLLPTGVRVVTASPPCPAPTGCALGDLAPGATVTVTRTVTADVALDGAVAGTVTTPGPDANPANNSASTPFGVRRVTDPGTDPPGRPRPGRPDPAVALKAAPRTAYAGGRFDAEVVVRNEGPRPATGLRLVVAVPSGVPVLSASRPECLTPAGCPVADLGFMKRATVRLVLGAEHALTGAVTATVTTTGGDSRPGNNSARAPLTVREPLLRLVPPAGPPGAVAQASGEQFPPGVELRLRWSKGVTVASAPVVVRADGTFSAPMLVLVQDALGERRLSAAQAGVRAPARALFRPVTADYLVVPGVLQPGDFQWRR
ncbi:hypothetical protein [Streptomyces sp. NPDC093225]|uniref:hypothetical protein n=1 Tax=Streptomyces sp. NPDC093225 TaxID=3366034 RepID=UPI00380D186E